MAQNNRVSLATIKQGALLERFELELQKVMVNIADVNTKADETRSLSITVTIKPNESRDVAAVKLDVKSKLASLKSEITTWYLIEQDDTLIPHEHNPKQKQLEFPEEIPNG